MESIGFDWVCGIIVGGFLFTAAFCVLVLVRK